MARKLPELYWLVPGHETEVRVNLLLQLTSITSDDFRQAAKLIYVLGASDKDLDGLEIGTPSNVHRNLRILNNAAGVVERIKDLEWADRLKKDTSFSELEPGKLHPVKFELLLMLTKIRSEKMIEALHLVYVTGKPQNLCTVTNLNKSVRILNSLLVTIGAIQDLDWLRFRKPIR